MVWEQNCVWLFYYLNFERNYDFLKSKSLCFLLSKKINFKIKTKQNRKWKIPNTVLERLTLCSYKNQKLKLRWVGAREKKRAFFVPFVVSKGDFFKICVLSQSWIHFQNIYISKNTTSYTFVFKIMESLYCILKQWYIL